MKTKTQKDIKKEVIKENIFKALHIVGYASIGILALLGIVMGVQSCKSKNSHNNDSQQQLRQQPKMAIRDTTMPAFDYIPFTNGQKLLDYVANDLIVNNNQTMLHYSCSITTQYTYTSTTFSASYMHISDVYANPYTIYFNNSSSSVANYPRFVMYLSTNGGSLSNLVFRYGDLVYEHSATATKYYHSMPIHFNSQVINEGNNVFYKTYLDYANSGYETGYSEGYETGYSEGHGSGYSEGYETGYSEGVGDATPSEGPQNETIYLNGYDYRGWFGNVDTETGLIQYQVSQATYLTYGGVKWKNTGNGRLYNFVSMVIQPVAQNEVFAIGKEMEYDANTTFYNGRTGQQLYGSDYNKFSYISRLYYGYKEGYNGGEMENASWDYRDTIYEMPIVSCRNTEASYVSGWLSHDYNIAPLYRSMEIIQDSGTKFNTPKYNDVSIVELWKMDLNNYIGVSNPATEVNVFTMLSKAFNSITSVLSIEILPHMTLGLFLFVPLVVGIVFAVIKVIKK